MKQKIFLSSMLIMSVAPAMAETFPTDGYMKENKTYDNAATETNMDGVYEGTVNAVAEYDVINYIVNAGQYLPADSETVITCPAGSFCPGISGNVQYNQTTPQGIQTCPTGYASSTAGASSNTQCYRACDINNMGTNGSISSIAHATAISGNDYYGSGTDTCEPTACENGWHVKAAETTPNLTNIIGVSEAGTDYGYKSNSGTGSNYNESKYGITQNGEFVVDYGNKGKIHGHAQCSTRSATYPWVGNNGDYVLQSDGTTTTLPDSAGQYCYCQLDSYTTSGGDTTALSTPWVFGDDVDGDADNCASSCADRCAYFLRDGDSYDLAYRAAVFGSVGALPAMCEANVININWNDVDPATAGQNNEGTAVYGEDVRTPVKAQTKKGKTFKGWRFSKPEQVQSCSSITNKSTCSSNSNCRWDYNGETCVQSCESITEQNACYNRGSIIIETSEETGSMDHYENCYWKKESCQSRVTASGGASD